MYLFQGILDAICHVVNCNYYGQNVKDCQSALPKNLQLPGNYGNCTNTGPACIEFLLNMSRN